MNHEHMHKDKEEHKAGAGAGAGVKLPLGRRQVKDSPIRTNQALCEAVRVYMQCRNEHVV
jgi:hypothetical protein